MDIVPSLKSNHDHFQGGNDLEFLHTELNFTNEKMVVDPHDSLFKRLYDPTAKWE